MNETSDSGSGSCPSSSEAFASCESNNTVECFRTVLRKCDEERSRVTELLNKLRSLKRYPHTGFFQQHYGQHNQVNCRTKDKLANIQGVIARLTVEEMRDIYLANLRFQLSLQNLTLTRQLLINAVNEFIANVTEWEASLDATASSSTATTSSSSDDSGVSSTSGNVDLSSRSAFFHKTQNYLNVIQALLNQMPMLAGPLCIELKLMHIYDNYDDSGIVHRLLTDPTALSLLRGNAAATALPPMLHDWELIMSDESIRDKFRMMLNTAERQRVARQQ